MLLSLKLRHLRWVEPGALYLVATCAALNTGRRCELPAGGGLGAKPEPGLAVDGHVLNPGGNNAVRRRFRRLPTVPLLLSAEVKRVGLKRKTTGLTGAFTNQSFARGLVRFVRQVSGNILATY